MVFQYEQTVQPGIIFIQAKAVFLVPSKRTIGRFHLALSKGVGSVKAGETDTVVNATNV
jgi:hypothetical protein